MDDKIGAKDLPKDLQRLATKVIESEQDVEKTVGKKIQKKVNEGSCVPLLPASRLPLMYQSVAPKRCMPSWVECSPVCCLNKVLACCYKHIPSWARLELESHLKLSEAQTSSKHVI